MEPGAGRGARLVAARGRGERRRGRARTDEVVSNAAVMLFGGIETTEGMIANAIAHLLSHPDQLAAVRAEPALLANAIEESLRLEPAAAVIDRYATAATQLAGARIGERELVTVSIAGANRDPAVFAEPDAFDVRRPNAKLHAAFAHGPHVCIGMHLARLEAHTAVARVLERLPRPGAGARPVPVSRAASCSASPTRSACAGKPAPA
jgi:cytochrome P450